MDRGNRPVRASSVLHGDGEIVVFDWHMGHVSFCARGDVWFDTFDELCERGVDPQSLYLSYWNDGYRPPARGYWHGKAAA